MENKRYKVLLIEDDKLDQMAFVRMVEDKELPYDCVIAGSVSEARNILASQRFDIVISDYSLGDGTAFDLLDSVKNVPTIFVTGAGDEEIAIKAWKAGADDYLIKDPERNYLKTVPMTIENVIRRRKMEAELQLLSGAVTSTDDSIYITDMENKIIFVNKAFCETYGYKTEDILGKDSNILWIGKPHSERTRSVFEITRGAWEVGFYHKRKDNSIFPVSLSRSIIKDAKGNEVAVVGIARDVSERMLIEDELRTANQKLKKQNQLKSELAVTISEQLKAPLAALKNIICDAKADSAGQITPELQENLESAEKDINQVGRIVADFRDVVSIETGKMKLELTELNLAPVISEAADAFSSLAAEKDIQLECSISDSDLLVNADHNRITQVLSDLIKSSIRSTPSNGHINIRAKDIGNEIVVEVQDDGPTIEQDKTHKIFDRFEQIKELVVSNKEKDSTLALPIAKELVEMHGGCIWAESELGEGNKFCVVLPKAAVAQELTSVAVNATQNDHEN